MRLETIRRWLECHLNHPTAVAHFHSGRERHPVLAPFANPQEVIAYLHTRDIRQRRERSALCAAMLAEAQRGECESWASLLLTGLFPGLLGIRATMRPVATLDAEELDAMLLSAFLETVWTFPLASQGKLALVNLLLGTRKAVWRQLALESRRAATECLLPEAYVEQSPGHFPSPESFLLAKEAAALLPAGGALSWVEEKLQVETEDDLLLVLGTHASGKALIDWVRGQRPQLGAEALLKEYSRLRRRRSRVLARLRQRTTMATRHALLYPAPCLDDSASCWSAL